MQKDSRGRYVKEDDPLRVCKCGRNVTRNRYMCSECWTERARTFGIETYLEFLEGRVVKGEDTRGV